jgi:peptide/nickel transport system substrate-binding protein
VSFTPGVEIVLEAFDGYWRKAPNVKRIVMRSMTEETTRAAALKRGEVALAYLFAGPVAEELKRTPGIKLEAPLLTGAFWLELTEQWDPKSPWHDRRVRLAASHAIDRQAINQAETLGFSRLTGSIVPRIFQFAVAVEPPAYDPARAKKLLADAGYPNGFSTTLWVPESGSGMQSPVAMATVIQSNLKAVGVNATLQTFEWGAFIAKLRSREQELFALSWMAGNEDPDMVMYPLLHSSQWSPNGPNRALYKNEKFDELLHQARLTTDPGKRSELYRQAQRILAEDPPWIFIDHEIQTAAHSKRVQGFKLHPSFDLRVETISLK